MAIILSHPHNWAGAIGGYACTDCAAFIPDAKVASAAAPGPSASDDSNLDYVWTQVMGNAA